MKGSAVGHTKLLRSFMSVNHRDDSILSKYFKSTRCDDLETMRGEKDMRGEKTV
jgi:hypothetical protein